MSRGRRIVTISLAVALAAALPAAARPGPNPVEAACATIAGDVPEVGGRSCTSLGAFLDLLALSCRQAPPLADDDPCATFDGRTVSESAVDAYERSWVHRALTLQRQLDDSAPLFDTTWVHTHNSFNAAAYGLNVSDLDPNQMYTITDQLRMDVRAIEIDVHWVNGAVTVCHGEPVPIPGVGVIHAGCSVDRPLAAALAELRHWLEQPANRDDVVLLYLENNLDGEPAAHAAAARTIETELGSLVYRPPAGEPCAPMPYTTTKSAIRATGARVLIVGNCGPGAWGTWVHERGPLWDESSSDRGDDYPASGSCAAERASEGYGNHIIRWYEDSTWLSAVAGDGWRGEVTITEARRMAECGVNLIGFDRLTPNDPRLGAVVWSWAVGEPAAGAGSCASQGADGRFRATPCSRQLAFACRDGAGGWHVTATAGPNSSGAAACAGAGWTFATPANGWQNALLRAAAASAGRTDVWLSLR